MSAQSKHRARSRTCITGKLGDLQVRSFPLAKASAWPPTRKYFKKDTALARRKHRVTFQAGNLPVWYVARSLDTDDPVFCLATRAVEMIVSDLLIVKAG